MATLQLAQPGGGRRTAWTAGLQAAAAGCKLPANCSVSRLFVFVGEPGCCAACALLKRLLTCTALLLGCANRRAAGPHAALAPPLRPPRLQCWWPRWR